MSRQGLISGGRLLCCLVLLAVSPGFADSAQSQSGSGSEEVLLEVEVSQGGEDVTTSQVRQYFSSLGRDFYVVRVKASAPTPAKEVYRLHRESAGNFRYNALKISNAAFYTDIAESVNEHFEPLEDLVHYDDSEVTGEEFLQMLFWQATALANSKTDLESTDGTITATYVYDDTRMILVPTTFKYVDGATNTKGSTLHSDFGVNSFSKHYLLARIMNKRARVTMAGKLYVKVVARDDSKSLKLEEVFNEKGDVDLDSFTFEVTVSNESGTFKPAGEALPPFAQLLVDTLGLPELNYRAHVAPGQQPIAGTVYPSSAAQPAAVGN